MSAPGTLPTWDSNGTNLVAPTGGHQTDGYAINEVPTSTEMNGWMQLVGLWVAFLSLLAAGRWRWLPAGAGRLQGTAAVDPTTAGVITAAAVDGIAFLPVPIPVGETMTDIGISCKGDAVHDITFSLVKLDGLGTASTLKQSVLSAPAASWAKHTVALNTPYVSVDGESYHLAYFVSGGTTINVQTMGVKFGAT